MKKNDNKGFMITEILVTSTLVCSVLIFLYSQFYNIKRGYDSSFKYNTVNGLYAASNIKDFLMDNGLDVLSIELKNKAYIDLKEDVSITKDETYFNILISSLNIKEVLFTKANLTELIANLSDIDKDEYLKKFIRRIDFDKESIAYRLIIEYNDDTFATILVGDENNEK